MITLIILIIYNYTGLCLYCKSWIALRPKPRDVLPYTKLIFIKNLQHLEYEHLCLLRSIILEWFSVVLEWFPNSALQIFQCRDLGFYVSFLTVFYIDFQFPFGRIYLVTGYYSPQKGSFLKQYSYLKLCMYSFIKFRRAALLQCISIYPLLCFPYPREKFPHWEDQLFPPLPYPKGSSFNSCPIFPWTPRGKLLQAASQYPIQHITLTCLEDQRFVRCHIIVSLQKSSLCSLYIKFFHQDTGQWTCPWDCMLMMYISGTSERV